MLLLEHQCLFAQNLVPNNSFEEFKKCPKEEAEFNKNVSKWNSANKASPDYFNSCNTTKLTNTITNFAGSQLPYSGNAYVGIEIQGCFYEFREYIQCKLNEPLKTNQLYCCSFYISLADKSTIYTDRVGMFVSKRKLKTRNKLVINEKPQIENKEGLYLNNKTDWTLICDTLRAIGGEQYITIGNFFDDEHTTIKVVDNIKAIKRKYSKSYVNSTVDDAYYYIDEVSVKLITNKTDCACQVIEDSAYTDKTVDTLVPQTGKNIILKNVFFDIDKSTLLSKSFLELDNLVTYLREKNIKSITVNGYTDNVGTEENNQKLSEARAKAVADYLISKGISKDKINFKGYGSTNPIADNSTEDGRAKNRRVEIYFE